MNPGYLSLVIALIALILLASGWKDVLVKGIPHQAVYLFFVCWIVSYFIVLRVGSIVLYGSAVVFTVLIVCGLWAIESSLERVQAISFSLLLGSTVYMMTELARVSPVLSIRHPAFHAAVILSVMLVLLQRRPISQLTVLTMALFLSEAMRLYSVRGSLHLVIGSPQLQDLWWQAAAGARLGTVSLETGWSLLRTIKGRRETGREDDS